MELHYFCGLKSKAKYSLLFDEVSFVLKGMGVLG